MPRSTRTSRHATSCRSSITNSGSTPKKKPMTSTNGSGVTATRMPVRSLARVPSFAEAPASVPGGDRRPSGDEAGTKAIPLLADDLRLHRPEHGQQIALLLLGHLELVE